MQPPSGATIGVNVQSFGEGSSFTVTVAVAVPTRRVLVIAAVAVTSQDPAVSMVRAPAVPSTLHTVAGEAL